VKKIFVFILLLVSSYYVSLAQGSVHGKVFGLDENDNKAPLAKSSVVWMGTQKGVLTDKKGEFSIQRVPNSDKLVISFVGYKTDTITVSAGEETLEISLKQSLTTDEVRVTAEAPQALISTSSVCQFHNDNIPRSSESSML